MIDNTLLQYIESKLIDAGDTVSAKSLAAELNLPLREGQKALTEFVTSSSSDLIYYFIDVSEGAVLLKHNHCSQYCEGQIVEAVAAQHRTENLVIGDLECLLEDRLKDIRLFSEGAS